MSLRPYNWPLLAVTLTLMALGVVNLYSAGGAFWQRQCLWGALGIALMLFVGRLPCHRLYVYATPLYGAGLFLLLLVPLSGKSIYGARRWLDLGPLHLQPSEFIKVCVLIFAARLLAGGGKCGFGRFFAVWGMAAPALCLILLQPDLGTALLICFLCGGLLLYKGLEGPVFKSCLIAVPLILALFWAFGMHDYQRQRVLTFINPASDARGSGYHTLQARIAVGSGQMFGKGYMQGTQSRLNFLPERHSDFACAVFAEEWGFAGALALTSLYCLFLSAITSTAAIAQNAFASMLCVGIFFYFFFQVLVNMGMVLGLLPVVGVPLPFLSYGGSSMCVNCLLLGIVQGIHRRRYLFK